jgi:hypothetical protein
MLQIMQNINLIVLIPLLINSVVKCFIITPTEPQQHMITNILIGQTSGISYLSFNNNQSNIQHLFSTKNNISLIYSSSQTNYVLWTEEFDIKYALFKQLISNPKDYQ